MGKILGIDLGTNSIGLAVRNTDNVDVLTEQLEFFRSIIFDSGVGKGKNGEFSYAAQRTTKRSIRHLYWARKQKLWSTLRLLIYNGYCPLSEQGLEKWSCYDKKRGLHRQYPVDELEFEQWVRLDFNNDGKPDYTNPFEIRRELLERKFDLNNPLERYAMGRAIYHMAQHRAFKSSKGETLKEQEEQEERVVEDLDVFQELKKSEEKKSKDIQVFMEENGLVTVGQAWALLLEKGERIRESQYTAVRSQIKEELRKILDYQGIDPKSEFYKRLLSEKKDEGTLFYKRPLRSQKGLVGKCIFETDKSRCPVSHPEFEYFRALSLINNIRYRTEDNGEWLSLTPQEKEDMLQDRFYGLKRSYFKFSDLRSWIETHKSIALAYQREGEGTINYPDETTVAGCPVTARIIDLLGDDWKTAILNTSHQRVNRKTGEIHTVSYNYEDLWHLCFMLSTSDDSDKIEEIAENTLCLDKEKKVKLIRLYNSISQGYAQLSLKAIRNINVFLRQGLGYSHAVLMAKMPSILKEDWPSVSQHVSERIHSLIEEYHCQKKVILVYNQLVSKYHQLVSSEKFGYKDTHYCLVESDLKDIDNAIASVVGKRIFSTWAADKQTWLRSEVQQKYQEFFSKQKKYQKQLSLKDFVAKQLAEELGISSTLLCKKLYSPSMVKFYRKSNDGKLGSPVIDAVRNPMAMRVLHQLRRQINQLLATHVIDTDTQIVVETAREFNDANWRKAITEYQKDLESKREEIRKELKRENPNLRITDTIIDKGILWNEQGHISIYTGNTIPIAKLLDGNCYDFEHTVPRSISFDDSLANKTICESDFNRNIKQNQLAAQLSGEYNGKDIAATIKDNIKPWEDKVTSLKKSMADFAAKAKRAQTKDVKDRYLVQHHIRKLELEYWEKKVNHFKMKEYNERFRNNQLNDTRIITKYAYHYLKSLFPNVSVERGETTAQFRKILGIQKTYEKKNRDLHSHHAIDATVLTLIPNFDNKKALITLFYEKEEAQRLGKDTGYLDRQIEEKKEECRIPKTKNFTDFIQDNIIVYHHKKDQALTPAHRKKRIRGKVVKTADGNEVWQTGDCIRGQLHQESFYGCIKKDGELKFVIRRRLDSFKKWADLEKVIVDKALFNKMKSQFPSETEIDKAYKQGIYTIKTDKDGNTVKLGKIRHVRCFERLTNPLEIKRQTYLSAKDYKQVYYSNVGDLLYMCRYESSEKKKVKYIAVSLWDLSQKNEIPSKKIIDGIEYRLSHVYKKGDMVLVFKNKLKDIRTLPQVELIKHLYVIDRFESSGIVIFFHNSISSSSYGEKRPQAPKDDNLASGLRCRLTSICCLVLGEDFQIEENRIVFLK